MGARRDDITGGQRAQIAIEVLSPHRPWGTVTRLAQEHTVTRETIYNIRDAGELVLTMGLEPRPHGPQPTEKAILIDRNRLVRGTVALTEKGVSQRGVSFCLEELLDTRMSPSWVNAELVKVEKAAAVINEQWQPAVNETLSGDEIYSNDCPNLMVVGNDSLYIYALTRQPTCDGDTWGCILLECPSSPAMEAQGWRLVSRQRGSDISWIGITCCVQCGDKFLVWKDEHTLRWRQSKSVLPSLSKPTPLSGWSNIWQRGSD